LLGQDVQVSDPEMNVDVAMIQGRIRRAEQLVAAELVKDRRFYARVLKHGDKELIGYERDLVTEPLTDAEGRLLLASSLAMASESVLHLLYQGRHGLDIRRMRALISIVERTGRHEFAREAEIHKALRNGYWRPAANLLIEFMLRRGVTPKLAALLADQIRYGAAVGDDHPDEKAEG
jgi:hypothetical protein